MSLLDKLKGPTEEEYISAFSGEPDKLLSVSLRDCFYNGVEVSITNGANIARIKSEVLNSFLLNYFTTTDMKDFFTEINLSEKKQNILLRTHVLILVLLYENGLNLADISHSFILYYHHEMEHKNQIIPLWFEFYTMSVLTQDEKNDLYIIAAENSNITILRLLNEVSDYVKQRALNQATYFGHLNVIQYLLTEKVNIHNHYELALSQAVRSKNEENQKEIVELLLSLGADVSLSISYHHVLWKSIRHYDIIHYLKEYASHNKDTKLLKQLGVLILNK